MKLTAPARNLALRESLRALFSARSSSLMPEALPSSIASASSTTAPATATAPAAATAAAVDDVEDSEDAFDFAAAPFFLAPVLFARDLRGAAFALLVFALDAFAACIASAAAISQVDDDDGGGGAVCGASTAGSERCG